MLVGLSCGRYFPTPLHMNEGGTWPLNLTTMLHIPWFLKFCSLRSVNSGSNSSERYGKREGYLAIQCAISRWLTRGSDRNRNINSYMWPENVLTVLCYLPAAIPTLKVS